MISYNMAEKPAPRYNENNPLMAPPHMPLVEDNLQAGLGAIPGATKSEEIPIEEVDHLKSGLGVIP